MTRPTTSAKAGDVLTHVIISVSTSLINFSPNPLFIFYFLEKPNWEKNIPGIQTIKHHCFFSQCSTMDSLISSSLDKICSQGPTGFPISSLWPKLENSVSVSQSGDSLEFRKIDELCSWILVINLNWIRSPQIHRRSSFSLSLVIVCFVLNWKIL